MKYAGSVCRVGVFGVWVFFLGGRGGIKQNPPNFQVCTRNPATSTKAAWLATLKFHQSRLSYRSAYNVYDTLLASSAVIPAKLKEKKCQIKRGSMKAGG